MAKDYKDRSEVLMYGDTGYLVIGKKVDVNTDSTGEHFSDITSTMNCDEVLVQVSEGALVNLLKKNELAREELLRKAGFKAIPL